MLDFIVQTGAISVVASVVVTVLAPYVAAVVKRKENGRINIAALEVKRVEVTEARMQTLLDRQQEEISRLSTRLEEQERRTREAEGREQRIIRKYDRVLAALADAARDLRDELEGDDRRALADRMVQAISQARELFNGRESA